MGQLVYIGAKRESVDKLNKALEKMNIENDFTTDKHNDDWLRDINENSKSPQRHLKPDDRDLTMEELLRMFPSITEVGLLDFDVAFSRTTEEEAQAYLEFLRKYKKDIEYLRGAEELINRYETTIEQKKLIISLNVIPKPPKELPKDQQTTDDLQGGILLCKSWSTQPFWVIYGKCKDDHPTFMKKRIFEDDLYNDLYKDKQGHAYLLIPLIPMDNSQLEFAEKVYTACYNMGLRENPNFFIPFVYGLDLVNLNEVAVDYKEYYSWEEILDRFRMLFEYTALTYHYNYPGGFHWSDIKKRFIGVGGNETSNLMSKCSVMTALLRALKPSEAAELMSTMTGKKFLPFEFDMKNPLTQNPKSRGKKK